MYLPLRFLEQIDNYVNTVERPELRSTINKMSIYAITRIMERKRDFVFDTYSHYKDYLNGYVPTTKQWIKDEWEKIAQCYMVATMLMTEATEDFMNTILFTHIRNEWRMRKIVYRVSPALKETLVSMKMNKLVSMECITNLPSNYFYIDYSECEVFCGNDKGCIVAMNKSEQTISIICVLLLDNVRVNTVIMSIGVDTQDVDSNTSLLLSVEDTSESIELELESGTCVFKEREFKKFLLNFFTYMYAINKDVEVTERSVKLSKRSGNVERLKEPTNTYKEIEDYNVGFRYVKQPRNKVKYVHDEDYESGHNGSTKCTHYRQAHWHSYWTGKGEDKKLIVKWVEGVMVNGTVAKNVTVKDI